jgi:ABC-type sugar transport system substrate-binding protein
MHARTAATGMLAASALLVALAGCAPSGGGTAPGGTDDPWLPTVLPEMVTEVHALGTVLQVNEDPPQLCLGAIAE